MLFAADDVEGSPELELEETFVNPDGLAAEGDALPAKDPGEEVLGPLEAAGVFAELEPGVPTDEALLLEAAVTVVPLDGAGTAREGSTRAPVPHGMASPFGSVASLGGVVFPFASAMAKRVVQRVSGESGDVNW